MGKLLVPGMRIAGHRQMVGVATCIEDLGVTVKHRSYTVAQPGNQLWVLFPLLEALIAYIAKSRSTENRKTDQ